MPSQNLQHVVETWLIVLWMQYLVEILNDLLLFYIRLITHSPRYIFITNQLSLTFFIFPCVDIVIMHFIYVEMSRMHFLITLSSWMGWFVLKRGIFGAKSKRMKYLHRKCWTEKTWVLSTSLSFTVDGKRCRIEHCKNTQMENIVLMNYCFFLR